MRYVFTVVILIIAVDLHAQTDAHYGRFLIGSDFVRPSTTMPYPNGFGGTSPDSTWRIT